MSQQVLQVHGVSYAYPDGTKALDDVSFTMAAGDRVALLGPNGAGKTTLLLALIGVLTADAGSIEVSGLALDDDTVMDIRRRTGLVFQDPNDQLFMPTVRSDVAFGPANFGVSAEALEDQVATALRAVDMADTADRPPHHLSLGERRKVAIATVLAMEPDLLLLDEPAASLDPSGQRRLVRLLAELERTLLVATHDLPLALELCPRSIVLNQGRVVGDGPTAELLRDEDFLTANSLELPYGLRL